MLCHTLQHRALQRGGYKDRVRDVMHNRVILRVLEEYQPSGEGGTRSPPATPHRLQNPKCLPADPKMADGAWVFGRSKQFLRNKFFDPSTPSMRKGRDREKKNRGKYQPSGEGGAR